MFKRLYNNIMANEGWISNLHEADAIIFSNHSQGSIVSTHLLNRLIQDGHITTAQNHKPTMRFGTGAETFPSVIGMPEPISRRKTKVQRVCCVALCGIHLWPLSSSTLVQPYIQVSWFSVFDHRGKKVTFGFKCFESIAARELFEFQVFFRRSRYLSLIIDCVVLEH